MLTRVGSCPTARPPMGLLWNVLFHFVLGGVALSKMAPGGLGSGHTGRRVQEQNRETRQKLKAQIEKMEHYSDQRPCRICGICLYECVVKSDPVAMVWYGPRYGPRDVEVCDFKEKSLGTCFGAFWKAGG